MYLHELTSSFILLQTLDYFTSVIFFFLAVYILLRNPRQIANQASFWLLTSFFIWSFSLIIVHNPYLSKETAALFYDIGSIGWTSFAGLALYFAIILSGRDDLNRLRDMALIPLPIFIYLQWIGLLRADYVLQAWGWAYHWSPSVWTVMYYLYVVSFISAALYLFYTLWKRGGNAMVRGQAAIILLTGSISLALASLTDVIFPQLNIHWLPNIAPSCILIFAFGIIYAIGRYQFALSEQEIIARTEKSLQQAKSYAENVIRSANVLIVVLDTKGDVVSLNETGENLTGYKQSEIIGKNWFELIVPRVKFPQVWQMFETVRKRGVIADTFENPILTRSGEERIISWKNSTLLKDGKIDGTLSFGLDITERRKTEDALRASEKKYRQLVETLQEGIWAIDKDSNTTYVNPRMAEILGYTPQEMLGKPLFSFMDEHGVELAKQNVERRKQGIKEQHDFEFMRKDGGRVYASLETAPLLDEKGNYAGALAGIIDITARRKTEEELKRKMLNLEKFQAVTVERELKMKELKARIKELEERLK